MIERFGGKIGSTNFIADSLKSEVNKAAAVSNIVQSEAKDWREGIFPKKEIDQVVQVMNEVMENSHRHLKFEFHDQLNEYYVTIIDQETNEIIREIPPKKLLDMFAAMTEFVGLMVDKKI